MAVTIHQKEEAGPYPDAPEGVSFDGLLIPAPVIWARLEQWIAHRWSARAVVWVVEGPGEWSPPLVPAVIDEVEAWHPAGWQAVSPALAPLGYDLARGKFRFTATVGEGPVPDDAAEAYRRLAEYCASEVEAPPGVTSHRISEGDLSISWRRNASHIARAIHNSGAADLLRPYRRA